MQGVFITGTDTNIGKTMVAAAFMHRYRSKAPLCYWKPIQTGIEADDDTETVRNLGECSNIEVFESGVRLPRPLSPHLSARLAGATIDLKPLLQSVSTLDKVNLVVEGAGGVLVPLNDEELVVDLIKSLNLPSIIVARSGLGTINHTLMTLGTLRQRGLGIAGIVMVGPPNPENRAAIEHFGESPVLGMMPHFASLTAERLKFWAQTELDPLDHLAEIFS